MGCDIHMYPEYRSVRRRAHGQWDSFGGRINPGRHYELFGHIAGVRHTVTPIVEARGLPDDIGWKCNSDAYLLVSDENTGDGWCSTSDVLRWGSTLIKPKHGAYPRVLQPDWHTFTWLTPTELKQAMARCEHDPSDEYFALLAALLCLEGRGNEARVVIWFDN